MNKGGKWGLPFVIGSAMPMSESIPVMPGTPPMLPPIIGKLEGTGKEEKKGI